MADNLIRGDPETIPAIWSDDLNVTSNVAVNQTGLIRVGESLLVSGHAMNMISFYGWLPRLKVCLSGCKIGRTIMIVQDFYPVTENEIAFQDRLLAQLEYYSNLE